MILISSINFDASTDNVIDWLLNKKKRFFRLNNENKIEIVLLTLDNFIIKIGNDIIESKHIYTFWNRKGNISIKSKTSEIKDFSDIGMLEIIRENESKENEIFVEFIYRILTSGKKIGTAKNLNNKLITLSIAQHLGIKTPQTVVITTKSDFIEAHKNNNRVVTKAISGSVKYKLYSGYICAYTRVLHNDVVPFEFAPSLLQLEVEKEYEIRCFYFNGKFFSMAIFPEKNREKSIDLREHLFPKSRNVPYKLPQFYEEQLNLLMRTLNLDTGSLDIIKSVDGNYYFLEVNPTGIFENVSFNCNYHLEKIVAEYLSN